eukprot:SAG31_NODE_19564_length_598_cov_1.460922_1_plen_110_part_00
MNGRIERRRRTTLGWLRLAAEAALAALQVAMPAARRAAATETALLEAGATPRDAELAAAVVGVAAAAEAAAASQDVAQNGGMDGPRAPRRMDLATDLDPASQERQTCLQ